MVPRSRSWPRPLRTRPGFAIMLDLADWDTCRGGLVLGVDLIMPADSLR